MSNEIVVAEQDHLPAPLSVEKVQTRVAQIKQIMDSVMKPDVHYGEIKTKKRDEDGNERKLKPVLFQPGAEKLLMTFQLAASHEISDLSTVDEIRYRVRCVISNTINGAILGDEWGECSSNEEKYAWHRTYIQEEYDATPVEKRRIKYSKWDGKVQEVTQIKNNPADQANTILAMACKRAKVRAARAALAASDLFEVNIEDLPPELQEEYFDAEHTPDADIAEKARKREQAKKTEQRAHAGASGKPAAAAADSGEKVSKDQVRAFMQAMEAIPGFTTKYEKDGKQKTGFTDDAKEFLRSVGCGSFFPEMAANKGATVIAALQSEAKRRGEAKAAPVSGSEEAVPPDGAPEGYEDPYADQ